MVKDNIQQYIAGITLEFDRCQDMSIYSAEQIASVMKLKRNTVSGYLNQLAAEGSLVKINSRPVYFLNGPPWSRRWAFRFMQTASPRRRR